MATEPHQALTALRRALRGRVPYHTEVSAALLGVAVTRTRYPLHGGGRRKGGLARVSRSTKRASVIAARNATMRWGRLFTAAANAALLVTGVPVAPAYLGLAGIVIFGSLRSLVTRELSERDGAIIYVMWRRGGTTVAQPLELLRPEVNRELRALGKSPMTVRELRDKLAQLSEYGCITPTLTGWRLKDCVWLTA